jgi:hypothetical protein
MLIEIYMLFWVVGLSTMLMSFIFRVKRYEFILLPFLSMAFFFFLGIVSYDITRPYCEYSTAWTCYSYSSSEPAVGFLAYGLGMVMLIYSIYNSVVRVSEEITK